MTIANWMQVNSIWIALVISVLLLVYFVIGIIKTIRTGRSIISPLAVILLILGFMFLIFLIFNASEIKGAAWAEILLLIGLVTITAVYANANVKMAEEMREQRYDAVRPVIDIKEADTLELSEESKTTNLGSLMEVAEGNIPPFIYCSIYNVGLGTALDTYTEIDFNGEIFPQHYLGTITCGENKNPLPLRVKKEDEHHVLTVTYKDMYGRDIKSNREVLVQNHSIELGPLHIVVNGELKKND